MIMRSKRAWFTGAAALALAACSSGGATSSAPVSSGYWTRQRLEAAQAEHAAQWLTPPPPVRSPTPSAKENVRTLRVGALFDKDTSGGHFCTASVVASPQHDLIVTAAHCINQGNGGANKEDIAFVPAYADGTSPFGVWLPSRIFMDQRWIKDHDEALDVAFVTLQPHEGRNIEEVLGANQIEFNPGFVHEVRVTGYPVSADAPITCVNWTSKQSEVAVKFPCANYYGGTSGSPWVTGFNDGTRTGTIVGVLGGYQEGGDTADISYSSYLGDDVKTLYEEAIRQ